MIYVLNKNKIFSYMIASCIVLMLFGLGSSIIQNRDVELVKVSANTREINNVNIVE